MTIINDITSGNGLERHQVKTKCKSTSLKEFKEFKFFGSNIVSSIFRSSLARRIKKTSG